MKTKTKKLALAEIAIVLCSVFLVATLPAIASEQTTQEVSAITTASEDDFILEIYGNANEDDTIDMRDYTYTSRIICWLEDETTFADANYDGRISVADMTQIGLIVLGRESELTIVDTRDRIVTVNKPVERIGVIHDHQADAIRVLETEDKVVGVGYEMPARPFLYPVMSQLPCVFGGYESLPDIEAILNLEVDLIFTSVIGPSPQELEDKLEGTNVKVVRLHACYPESIKEEFLKMGYILDKRSEAEEFIDFVEGIENEIRARLEGISEDEKTRVLGIWPWMGILNRCWSSNSGIGQAITMAGGINIAAVTQFPFWFGGNYPDGYEVDEEWIIEQNPDIIVAYVSEGRPDPITGYGTDNPTNMIEMRDEIMNRPEWAHIKVVENEKVYIHSQAIADSPQICITALYFAKWFYPERFRDLDPAAFHQEFIDRFFRIDYNVYEHGVFVYHPEEHPDGE